MKRSYINLAWDKVSALLTVKGQHRLRDLFLRINLVIGGRTSPSVHVGTQYMISRFLFIRKTQGLKGLVTYLKVCYVCLQQSLGNHVLPDLTLLGPRISRTRKGYPRCIPAVWRKHIKTLTILRYCLSVFALYRVLMYPGTAKVKTITDPFKGDIVNTEALSSYIPVFFESLGLAYDSTSLRQLKWRIQKKFLLHRGLVMLPKKAPTTDRGTDFGFVTWSSHYLSVNRAIYALFMNKTLWRAFTQLGYVLYPWLLDYCHQRVFQGEVNNLDLGHSVKNEHVVRLAQRIDSTNLPDNTNHPTNEWFMRRVMDRSFYSRLPKINRWSSLGRLGLKQEPAGKVRVFAMVDPITQWVLRPIHLLIFRILRRLKTDGTFNQVRPLLRSSAWNSLYSLDLSAATDRLPISLQTHIVSYLYKDDFVNLGKWWGDLLTKRSYYMPAMGEVQYAVGQPMGALSSWAMLALTHHFIVHVAAWKSGVVKLGKPFSRYAILGDDIVIGSKPVAMSYLNILNDLGVECGLHKSLLSPDALALEFAKRFFYKGQDASPVSLRELLGALYDVTNLVSFGAKYGLKDATLAKVAGFGYKVVGGLNKPFYKLSQKVRDLLLLRVIPIKGITSLGMKSLTQWRINFQSEVSYKFLCYEVQRFYDEVHQFIDIISRSWEQRHAGAMIQDFVIRESGLSFWEEKYEKCVELAQRIDRLYSSLMGISRFLHMEGMDVSINRLFQEFISLQREFALLGLDPLLHKTGKFGIDPRLIAFWKRWTGFLSNYDSGSGPVYRHSSILPLSISLPVIRRLLISLRTVVAGRSRTTRYFMPRGGSFLPNILWFGGFIAVEALVGSVISILLPAFFLLFLDFLLGSSFSLIPLTVLGVYPEPSTVPGAIWSFIDLVAAWFSFFWLWASSHYYLPEIIQGYNVWREAAQDGIWNNLAGYFGFLLGVSKLVVYDPLIGQPIQYILSLKEELTSWLQTGIMGPLLPFDKWIITKVIISFANMFWTNWSGLINIWTAKFPVICETWLSGEEFCPTGIFIEFISGDALPYWPHDTSTVIVELTEAQQQLCYRLPNGHWDAPNEVYTMAYDMANCIDGVRIPSVDHITRSHFVHTERIGYVVKEAPNTILGALSDCWSTYPVGCALITMGVVSIATLSGSAANIALAIFS